jgi:hypothetical protein
VSQPPDVVYGFLADLDNHWRLASGFVSLDAVDGAGGWITVRGPFGISRRAQTRLVRSERAAGGEGCVEGLARTESGTVARVSWRVAPAGSGSRVELAAAVSGTRGIDRVLLWLGGGRWLALCLRRTLARLEDALQRR